MDNDRKNIDNKLHNDMLVLRFKSKYCVISNVTFYNS